MVKCLYGEILHDLYCTTCGKELSDRDILEMANRIIDGYAKEAEEGYDVGKLRPAKAKNPHHH